MTVLSPLYKYYVFSLTPILGKDTFLDAWIYVHADNVYIARMLIYFYYYNIKNVKYINSFDDIKLIKPPEGIILDGYSKETYENFKIEYSFDF